MKTATRTFLVLSMIGTFASTASAATATATLTVSATVTSSCVVTNGTLAFGNYNPVSATPNDNQATFTVACTKNTNATLGLNAGSNASGATRRMFDGGSGYLTYELYQDAGRTTVWGNSAGSWVGYSSTTNTAQSMTVYGRVPALQDVPASASYADTVTITVTF